MIVKSAETTLFRLHIQYYSCTHCYSRW